jgi:hypothetical protein
MTLDQSPRDELHDLLLALEDGSISAEGIARIDELVRGDSDLLRQYLEHVRLVSDLRFGLGSARTQITLAKVFSLDGQQEADDAGDRRPPRADDDAVPFPTIVIQDMPGASRTFFPLGGLLFSYLIACVIVGIGLLAGWACRMADYQDFAANTAKPAPTTVVGKGTEIVGRITSFIDCQWSDPQTAAIAHANVPLGRKYALASGILEITYDAGAKVILQGPCNYTVESKTGGFLSLGRLTALVEQNVPKPASHNSPDSTQLATAADPPSLFVVRTPTAVVTDLGTEFGVEVSKNGNTLSRVFRGAVKAQGISGGQLTSQETILRENQSVRIERESAGGVKLESVSPAASAASFVRHVGRRAPKAGHARLLSEFDFENNTKNSVHGAPDGVLGGVAGTSAPYVAGKIGEKALDFNGVSTFVNASLNGYPNCTAGLQSGSYSFWVNSSHLAATEMVVHTSGKGAAFSVRLNCDEAGKYRAGGIYFVIRSQDSKGKFDFGLASPSPSRWADGQWHMVTVVWNATQGEVGTGNGAIYIDGISQRLKYENNSIANDTSFGWYTHPVAIGANSSSAGTGTEYRFKGVLDDVAAWRGQLDAVRIRALYNLGCDPVLNYGAKDEQKLANIFAVQGVGTTSDGKIWQYATGLVGNPGDVVNHSAVVLDANGNGVQFVTPLENADSDARCPVKSASTKNAEKGGGSH